MDSKKHTDIKEVVAQKKRKRWFWIRLIVSAFIIFFLWWFIAPFYEAIISSFVTKMMDMLGFYVEKSFKLADALMSPVIPFLILMIATWGIKLFYTDKKFNLKLFSWTIGITLFLTALSMIGQYIAVYMSVTNSTDDFLIFLGGFLIATAPVLVPIIAWLALSHQELRDTFIKA